MQERKEIVIVGGGIFGVNLIALFRQASQSATANIHITLIEARDDFVYLPLNIRNCIEDVSDVYVKPYDRLFAKRPELGTVKQGLAVSVDQTRKVVVLKSGEEVRYDVLVLATGTDYNDPNRLPHASHSDLLAYFAAQRDLIANSYHIIIIGGGATGVELAAEIADRYRSKKKVTLLHSRELPLTEIYSDKLRQQVLTFLLQSRVEVLLKSRATQNPDGTITVVRQGRKGEKPSTEILKGNTVFLTASSWPCTSAFPEAWKDDRGLVKVKPTLQLLDDDSVFAVGDITDIKEAKTAGKAHYQLPVVFSNIMALVKNKQPPKLYTSPAESIALQMGKGRATGQAVLPLIGPVLLPSWLLAAVQGDNVNAERGVKPVGY